MNYLIKSDRQSLSRQSRQLPLHKGALGAKEENMKHGKRPTVKQKMFMTKWHLNYENWLVVKDTPTEMEIVHRISGKIRVIKKGERE